MTPEQVKQLVEQHPNLSQEQKDKILKNLKVVTLAQNRRVDITLSSTGQQSVRQFPFNAEDARNSKRIQHPPRLAKMCTVRVSHRCAALLRLLLP